MNRQAFRINGFYWKIEDGAARKNKWFYKRSAFYDVKNNVNGSISSVVFQITQTVESELRAIKEAERLRKWRKSMGYS